MPPSVGIQPSISRQGGETYPQQHERLVPPGGCQRGQESIQREHREDAGPHPPLRRPRSTSVRQVGEDDCGHDREYVGQAGQSDNNGVEHSPISRLARELHPRTRGATKSARSRYWRPSPRTVPNLQPLLSPCTDASISYPFLQPYAWHLVVRLPDKDDTRSTGGLRQPTRWGARRPP